MRKIGLLFKGKRILLYVCGLFIVFGTLGFYIIESQRLAHAYDLVYISSLSDEELFALGEYYFNQDDDPALPYDLNKAEIYYKELVSRGEKVHPFVWHQLGRIEFLRGNFNEAIRMFDKQLEYFGDEYLPSVHYMLGLTYGYRARRGGTEDNWNKAEEHFLTFIDLMRIKRWAAYVDLSWIYFAQGKYEKMYTLLEDLPEEQRDNAWVQNMFGLALLHTDRETEAHSRFLRAQELANTLTPLEWGTSYPGNDPDSWERGLEEMRKAIAYNVTLTAP